MAAARAGVWLSLLAACTAPEPTPHVVVADDTGLVTDGHGHEDDVDHPPVVPAPLCQVQATRPPMAPDMQSWAETLRNSFDRFHGRGRLDELLLMGDELGDTPELRGQHLVERGFHRLRMGEIDDAIKDLQEAEQLAAITPGIGRGVVRKHLIAAWLRKAELDNCVSSEHGEACLVPFDEAAQHTLTEGMTSAIAVIEALLTEDDPEAIQQVWLLDVAHMALGTWPEGVRPEWRGPGEALGSEASAAAWTNVAPSVGLTEPTGAGSPALDDFDGDGNIDLVVSGTDPMSTMRLYLRDEAGGFCEASDASGLSAIPGVLGFSAADFDNDGDIDIAAPHGAWTEANAPVRISLLRNDGTGRFEDVAVEAGVADAIGPSQVAMWADVDLDGWLDLFVGRESLGPELGVSAPSSLYINQRDGSFIDVAEEAGLRMPGHVKGAVFGDVDNDGDPDLYVSVMSEQNRLYVNLGNGRFHEVARDAGITDPISSFATWMFDHDQDGDLDIFAAAYAGNGYRSGPLDPDWGTSERDWALDLLGLPNDAETARLYRNDGVAGFVDISNRMGLDDAHATMGASFGDLDADGYPDIYLGTGAAAFDALEPNTAYWNDAGRAFYDVTAATGLGHLQKGHGVAFGDIDEDGDEDILADVGGAWPADTFPNALFLNPANPGHAAVLRLEGVTSNRSAFGARVRVVAGGRTWHFEVGKGSSFGGNSRQVEVPLSGASWIERVEIDWPGGETEVLDAVPIDEIVWLRQGEGVVDHRPLARIQVEAPEVVGPGHE